MAPSLVQSKSGTATTGTSVTVTLTSGTTTGNCLVVCVGASDGTTNPTVSGITLGGSAGNFAFAEKQNSNADTDCEIWADPDCAGSQTSVVVSFNAGSGSNLGYAVQVMEWSGVATSSPVDKTNGALSGSTSSFSSGSTGTLSQASEVVIGAVMAQCSSGTETVAGPSSPWTNLAQAAPAASMALGTGYQVVSATTAQTYSGTLTAASVYGAAVVTLKGAASGVTSTGSLALTGLAVTATPFNAVPGAARPGSIWPGDPQDKGVSSSPVLKFIATGYAVNAASGSFSLAPLHASGAVQVSAFATISGGLPSIAPGPMWLAFYKPQLPRRPQPVQLVPAATGGIALGSLAFSANASAQNLFIFIGHYAVSYPDYADVNTRKMLACIPQQSYNMYVVSFRAGLTDPPLDGRWKGVPGLGDEVIFVRSYDDALAVARTLNANLQAVNARKSYQLVSGGTPAIPGKTEPPSEASMITAAARNLNAELQARMARGEKIVPEGQI
jgi:hypothetical protein